jgi:hypothetical protein
MKDSIKFFALFFCILICLLITAEFKTPLRLLKGEPYQRIGLSAALELHQLKETLFIDARLGGLYEQGHISGSVSIEDFNKEELPASLKARVGAAPNVVLYGGRNKAECYHALNKLSRLRPRALSYYEAGWPEWSHLKLPAEIQSASS